MSAPAAESSATPESAEPEDDVGDTIEDALALDVGDVGVEVRSSLDYGFDLDVFAFEAQELGYYVFDVALGTLPDSVLLLFGPDGTWLGRNDNYGPTRASRLYWTASAEGTYYVAVGAPTRDSTGSYTLTVAFAPTTNDDDHGRSSLDGTTVSIGEPVAGELERASDVDAFLFEAEAGLIYEAQVKLETLPDSYLSIVQIGGAGDVSNDDHGDSQASRIVWKAGEPARYVARVGGRGTGTYTLEIQVLDVVDDYGDTGPEATTVVLGRSVPGSVDYQGDIDVFTFPVDAGAFYEIDLVLDGPTDWIMHAGMASSQPLNLHQGLAFAYSRQGQGYSESRLVWKAPLSGESHVFLYGIGQPLSYQLTVRGVQISDDHVNTTTGATTLEPGGTAAGEREYDGDVDVFVFEAEADARYQFDLPSSALFRTHVRLEDANGRQLATAYNTDDDQDLPFSWQAREAGSYFLWVDGAGKGSYTLSLSQVEDDHANTADEATSLSVGEAVAGSIEYDYDSDAFVFQAQAGVLYEIGVELGTLSKSRLSLVNEDGEELARDDDYRAPAVSAIFWHASTAGRYYVTVRPYSWRNVGSYSLTVHASQNTDAHANTQDGATAVEIGDRIRGSLDYDDDVDVFVLQAEEGEYYEIRPESGTPPHAWVQLTSAGGERLARTFLEDQQEQQSLIFEASIDETYFIEVHGHGTGAYTLAVNRGQVEDDHSVTQSGATELSVNEPVHGQIDYEMDDDMFAFQAEQGQVYAVDVDRGALSIRTVDIGPYPMRGLAFCVSREDPDVLRRYWVATHSGVYYVPVGGCGPGSLGSYTVTLRLVEDDHSDTASEATAVVVGEAMSGALDHPADVDSFLFGAEAGQLYEIRAVRGTLQYVDVSVLCSPDEDLRDFSFTNETPVIWKAPRTGDFVVCVGGHGTGSYSLTVSLSDIEDDHADIPLDATEVNLGEASSGMLDHNRDVDAFRFAVEEETIYEIRLELGTLSGVVVSTKAPLNCELRRSKDVVERTDVTVTLKARTSTSQYVYVCGAGVGSYTLTVSALATRDDHPDTPGGSSTIGVDETVFGKLDYAEDIDFFTLEAEQGIEYTIDMSSNSSSAVLLKLGDLRNPLLASDDNQERFGPLQIVWEAPVSGSYYVAVYGFGLGGYALTVSADTDVDVPTP